MALTHQGMMKIPLLTHQVSSQITMTDIRESTETENILGVSLENADIVKHGSLLHELQVELQFRMFSGQLQSLVSHRTAMHKQNTLQFILFRIIFVNQSQRIHGEILFYRYLCRNVPQNYNFSMSNPIKTDMKLIFVWGMMLFPLVLNAQIRTGAEQIGKLLPLLEGKRVSLVVNQTSRCGTVHLLDTLYRKVRIVQLFAPEHGIRGKADAGETVSDGRDSRTGIPIVSLYGKNKKPDPGQLQRTDAVVFDLQDVGARFYTYISTLYYVMQACAENDKEVIVLDRPNPCDYVDGPVLDMKYKSFVGMLPIPLLHGCTMGEMARMINGEGWLGNGMRCRLTVIPVEGWKHGQPYPLPVKPSPNLPNDLSIALYPSLCPFEGTSVSVGRGTLFPFQVIGSPFLQTADNPELDFRFTPQSLPGYDKNPLHKGKICRGMDLRKENSPQGFSLHYVILFYRLYKQAGYAGKFFSRPQWFDLLMGTNQVRADIQDGKPETEIRSKWQKGLERYSRLREKYLLYESL